MEALLDGRWNVAMRKCMHWGRSINGNLLLSQGCLLVGCKWMLTVKLRLDKIVDKCKAFIVAKGEAERIKRYKGRVFALRDEPDVARVWLPNYDSPGLAMARAFGDFCLKDFGLISVPEMSYRRITEKDEFIVLATDGIWDVLSNKEVVDIVASAPAQSSAARSLVEHAIHAWRFKYPTSKVDDCAVVCLFLDPNNAKPKNTSSEARLSDAETTRSPGSVPCENINGNDGFGSPWQLPDGAFSDADN